MSQVALQTTPSALQPYAYDVAALSQVLRLFLEQQLPAGSWQWLEEKAGALNGGGNAFMVAFAAMPRKTGRQVVARNGATEEALAQLRPGFTIRNWTLDRLARVWLLLQLDVTDRQQYIGRIEQLFPAAEMNELVALYSALPLYAYPEAWRHRCTEGIRSNIGTVLEAVITNNPYPAEQLEAGAWNQLVMKGFFTDKRMDQVIGFDVRVNGELAQMLRDFAHERWAAGRAVPPLLWRGVAPFVNADSFTDLVRAFYSENSIERDAAALACAQSGYAPAQALLDTYPAYIQAMATGELSWVALAERAANAL